MVGSSALTNWTGQRVISSLRVEIFDRASRQRLEFYTRHSEVEIQTRLVSDLAGVDRLLTGTAQSILGAVTGLITAVIAMLVISWPLALLSSVLALALSLLNNRLAQRRRSLIKHRQLLLTRLMRHIGENLSWPGILLGSTLGRTSWQRDGFVT